VLETANSFETQPPSVEDFRGRIGSGPERRLWLAYEAEGRIADYAFATQFNPREGYAGSVEASVYVHTDCNRRGIGRAVPLGQPPRP
jgi:phosphinothricin acetyltransferase